MIKIERRETDKTRLAVESLVKEKSKARGKYNTPEVIEALQEVFYRKCYICENKKVTSWEVEHLRPHGGNLDLKFDWNNLFWSCSHCNHIKGTSYTPILDCTKIEVDEIIAFRKGGYFGTKESLTFDIVYEGTVSQELNMTCELLRRVYFGKTAQERVGAKIVHNAVLVELSTFKNYVREYNSALGEDKKDLFCKITLELKSNSSFAAFKRWIIRDNPDWCNDFIDCWKN